MTSPREQTRRREIYQSLAHRAGLDDPRIIARGMRILVEDERDGVPTPHVSPDLRDRALNIRSGLPARLATEEIKVLAVIGSLSWEHLSAADQAILKGVAGSVRKADDERTSGETAFTLVLVLALVLVGLLLVLGGLDWLAWHQATLGDARPGEEHVPLVRGL